MKIEIGMKVEIVPATLRDLTYIAANMREPDAAEVVAAGAPDPWQAAVITWYSTNQLGGCCFVVTIDGNPEVGFGFVRQSELTPWLASAWMWGTDKTPLAVPEIMRWGGQWTWKDSRWLELAVEIGITRIEVRTLASHLEAHRWLRRMGASFECDLPDWGRDRMPFKLFAWRPSDQEEIYRAHVLRQLKSSTLRAAPADAIEGRER